MLKRVHFLLSFLFIFAVSPVQCADLTPLEAAWLQAGLPVIQFAQRAGLPLDIVVQPQDAPDLSPIGMGYEGGRCQLVLSMRGNPEAQAAQVRIPPHIASVVLEALVAHELGHCWRRVRNQWARMPVGLDELPLDAALPNDVALILQDMREQRREEGFADLVALSWTAIHHPAQYEQVQEWLTRERAVQEVDGGHHDTRVWLRMAKSRGVFDTNPSVFERVGSVWKLGLIAGF